MNGNRLIIPSIILGIVLIICALIVTLTWKSNYSSNQTITVTGSAKEDIVSDLAVLRGTLTARASTAEGAYRQLENQKPILLSYLNSKGFGKDKVEFSTTNSYPIYEIGANGYQTQNVKAYVYNQSLQFQSSDVYKIKEISLDISSLIEKGVNFNVQMPEYHYTKLADLKIKIQAEAAKDAMIRAQKIAEATGRDLGPMRNARMGVLQITPRFSNEVSALGINDLTSIDKEITSVVSASFEIE
jgi:uncharacterized protein